MLTTQMTMTEAIQEVVASGPGREALACGEVRLSYNQLNARISGLAHSLNELEVKKGDRVVSILPPGPDFACLFFAVASLGAVIVPLDPRVRRRSLETVLEDAEPIALVTCQALEEELLSSPSLHHVISTKSAGGQYRQLSDLSTGQHAPTPTVLISPEDLLALLYTSGTTGTPKATMHSHRSLIAPVVASIKIRELWIRKPNLMRLTKMVKAVARYRERLLRAAGQPQAILSTVGWHTITGLELMLQALLMGDRLIVMERFHPRKALNLIEKERVTVLVAVPMALQVMLAVEGFESYDTSSLLICGTGAAPCPPFLAREVQDKFGCAIHIGFGATETAGGIAASSLADSDGTQAETVGSAMPGIEIKIVDEHRRELHPGQVGELACRGENIMLGYYRAPEATSKVIDDEGWYYTGDLGMVDEQGHLRILGRVRDTILRGGQTVYPSEIEQYLASHPMILEVAVLGVPTKVGGEGIWAYVILQNDSRMTAADVISYCREELEPFKIPAQVRFVTEFPRSATGKPQKFKLRQMALEEEKGGEERE